MNQHRRRNSVITAAVTLTLFSVACSDSPSPTASSTVPTTPTATAVGSQPTTAEIIVAMERAIQDEYHAEATYQRVLADFGNVWPFINIVHAEGRHSEAVAGLFRNRGLEVPSSQWNLDNVARFDTVTEACRAAAQAERDNIALYDEFLKMSLPRDVQNVFTNNRRASLEGHLPAFETCARS